MHQKSRLTLCAHPDELALLFAGAKVPPSDARETTETVDDPDSSDAGSASQIETFAAVHSSSHAPKHITSVTPGTGLPSPQSASVTELSLERPQPWLYHPSLGAPLAHSHPLFKVMQLGIDRRLIVNRKRQLKMYRVWMQGKFQKL